MRKPALDIVRCKVTSWKGEGESPKRNQCVHSHDTLHAFHEDECGNKFDDFGRLIIVRNANRPSRRAS